MGKTTFRNIISKLDYVQHSVWNVEEMILKYSGNVSQIRNSIDQINSFLELINEKVNSLSDEIKALKSLNHN